jgi:DNA recombination protein RmuC
MELLIVVLLAGVLVALAVAIVQMNKPRAQDNSALLLQQQMEGLRTQMSESLSASTDTMNRQLLGIIDQVNKQLASVTGQMLSAQNSVGERLDTAARVVSEVHKGLGALSQATDRVFEVGKDIASLQEILRAPKLRGTLGEIFLGDLLLQILPAAHFSLQHRFKSGEVVDAVILLGSGMVPIDAKFPLENFRRIIETQDETEKKAARRKFITDVKKHIDAIASKYILPDEGTFDFALMYLPAENVYYETIIKDESFGDESSICSYALSRRVIPVSPNSFYAYLQAIVLGLRGMRIEESAHEIIQNLARLKGDFTRFCEEFEVMGKHITNIKNKYDDSSRRLERFGEKLTGIGEERQQALPGIPSVEE